MLGQLTKGTLAEVSPYVANRRVENECQPSDKGILHRQ
jgi:hypothetical protein